MLYDRRGLSAPATATGLGDGYRGQVAIRGSEVVFTRNGHDWTRQLKAILPPLQALTEGSALIDGEIVAIDSQGRTNVSLLKTGIAAAMPLKFYAFDLLELDGDDLSDRPLLQRKEQLEALLGARDPDDSLQFSSYIVDHGRKVFAAMCEGGHEGVIAKRADSRYIGEARASFRCVADPCEIDPRPDDAVLLTMKSQDTVAALDRLRAAGVLDQPIFCVQNGVSNERFALRRFPNVHGVTVMMPATFTTPGEVAAFSAPRYGVFDIGRYPEGRDAADDALAEALDAANIAAFVTPTVMESKYGKLLLNQRNIVEATLGRDADHGRFPNLLRAEAEAVLSAAGVEWRDVGAADPRRDALMRQEPVDGADRIGGSSTQSLAREARSIETDYLNGEIVLLGRLQGVPVPVNASGPERAHDPRPPPARRARHRQSRNGAGCIRHIGATNAERLVESPEARRRLRSCEDAVQEPAVRGGRGVLTIAGAVDPEALPGFVLDLEVVAHGDQLGVAHPPLADLPLVRAATPAVNSAAAAPSIAPFPPPATSCRAPAASPPPGSTASIRFTPKGSTARSRAPPCSSRSMRERSSASTGFEATSGIQARTAFVLTRRRS